MKVLNLYSGLGGNRKLWTDIEVTAVELNESIAKFYADHFPQDRLIIADAHQYLLEHFREYDFIWSSIECPTHSRARFWGTGAKNGGGKIKPVYPDMNLYAEILFLKHFFNGKWVVENVVPYYDPLIPYTRRIGRHIFWSNFNISFPPIVKEADINKGKRDEWSVLHGFDITGYKFSVRTDKILRNCVNPETGLHILNCAKGTKTVSEQLLF